MAGCAPCSDSRFLKFNRVCHYGKSNVIRRLEYGLKYFYEWALLSIGAWSEISVNLQTANNFNASVLRTSTAPGYTAGQVWEGFRKNWVYETGVSYVDTTGGSHVPTLPEVYVGGVLQSGNYSVNYPLGQIIFDSAISTSSDVKAAFSFKNVQVLISDEVPWYEQLQYSSWEPDAMFSKDDAGDWYIGGNHRVQLPCIIISANGTGTKVPYALGGGMVWRKQEVVFHIISEVKSLRDNLTDLILTEGDRCIQLVDLDTAAVSGAITLDCNGAVNGMMYPNLLSTYCWATARSENARLFGTNSYNCGLHDSTVRMEYSVFFNNLC